MMLMKSILGLEHSFNTSLGIDMEPIPKEYTHKEKNMIKMTLLHTAVLLMIIMMSLGVCIPAFAQSSGIKIGYVDLQRVIDSSAEGQHAQEEIKKRVEELEQQAKQMQEELQAMKADFEQQYDALTLEARSAKRDEIAKQERDYSRFVNDSQSELRVTEQRSLKQLLEEVGKIVVEYGKENNFTVILEAGNILYGAPEVEITEDIISLYNSRDK